MTTNSEGNILFELIRSEIQAKKIETEDQELINAYLHGDSIEDQSIYQETEPIKKEPSLLYKYILALAQAKDLPEPDVFVMGLAVLGEDKWQLKHRRAAWATITLEYAEWFDQHGFDISQLVPPDVEILPDGKKYIKSVTLDDRSGGFIMRFRYLSRDEHSRVMDGVRSLVGRKFHDGTKSWARMQEPHWTIPGDEAAAVALDYYLNKSRAEYENKRDSNPAQAAYWSAKIEQLPWDIADGVQERIQTIIDRAGKMVPLSEAHFPSPDFKLRHSYVSTDGKAPFAYQIAGVEYMLLCTEQSRFSQGLSGNGVMCADPMGTGKTLSAGIITVVESWLQEMERNPEKKLEDLRVLILAPANAKIGWSREMTRWVGDMGFSVQILRGLGPKIITGNFVICNPELLKKQENKELNIEQPLPLFTMLLATRWFGIVADESHIYRTWRSQRTSNALELFSGRRWDSKTRKHIQFRLPVPLRIMLTGTPILNRPTEYASQLEALGLLELFGGQARFESEFSNLDRYSRDKRIKALKDLHYKLRQLGYLRREKETMVLTDDQRTIPLDSVPPEILNRAFMPEDQWAGALENKGWKLLPGVLGQLPPKIRTVAHLPISNRRVYRQAEKDLFSWILEEFGDDPDLEEQMSRARRGYALKLISTLRHLAEEGKILAAIKWLEVFLQESDDQKIVFYTWHLHVQDKLIEAFPGAAVIRGGQSEDQRQANIDRFQLDSKCRVILCMLQAGGQAITLTAAHHLAFLSFGWNPSIHDQAEDRIWGRVNDLHGASIYYLAAEDTIDVMMAAIIDKKREVTMASIQGADAEESMIVELISKMADRARTAGFADMLGISNDDDEDDAA